MKLGGLFSGIGGFELAWQRAGGTIAWMCEIDPAARRVLEARFPGVPIYPDVSELDPDEVEPVDVLTGGSPCQGFSIAGARTGLDHAESRLFADHIRIMDGLAARGLKWALWENVPGVLSITNDQQEYTFEHVVAALVGADEPVRLSRRARWNSGLADRGGRAVAWRVVDSRHFGVPQRRRRVYACVAFGDSAADRAGRALLAKSEGVRGDTAACGQAGQGVAGTLGGGSGSRSWAPDTDRMTFAPVEPSDQPTIDAQPMPDDASRGIGNSQGNPTLEVVSPTIKAGGDLALGGHGQAVLVPRAFGVAGASGVEYALVEEQPTLTASHGKPGNVLAPKGDCWTGGDEGTPQAAPAVLMTMREGKDGGGKGPLLAEEESLTLATGNGQTLFQPQGLAENQRGELVMSDYAHAVTSGGGKPGQGYPAVVEPTYGPHGTHEVTQQVSAAHAAGYGVRRLTPTECERLQGFPDGWTEPAGSDSARYRACGNAVTVNVPEWLFARILKVDA